MAVDVLFNVLLVFIQVRQQNVAGRLLGAPIPLLNVVGQLVIAVGVGMRLVARLVEFVSDAQVDFGRAAQFSDQLKPFLVLDVLVVFGVEAEENGGLF